MLRTGAIRYSSVHQSRTLFAIPVDSLVIYGLAVYGGQHRSL